MLSHLSRLGLQVNWEKRKLSPMQKISLVRLGQPHSTSLSRACSVDDELPGVFPRKRAVPLKHFQRLLGHMASTAAVTPLGLLHMRPLQRWLHDRVPRWAWRHGRYRVSGTPSRCHTFSPWSDLAFLQAGVPLAQVSRHVVVSTDASTTGWGAMCNGHAAAGLWTGPQLQWHINFLKLLAVWLAPRHFKTLLHKRHVLVRTDNTVTVAYINHQAPVACRNSPPSSPLESEASEVALRRLCTRQAQSCSRRALTSAHPSGRMATHTSHCQLFYSLSEGTLGTDALAHSWPRGLRKYAFFPVSFLAQTLCKVREDEEQVLLVAPYWPNRTWFPELMLLATATPWQIPLRRVLLSQRGGTHWHPHPDLWNLHVWFLDGTQRF